MASSEGYNTIFASTTKTRYLQKQRGTYLLSNCRTDFM